MVVTSDPGCEYEWQSTCCSFTLWRCKGWWMCRIGNLCREFHGPISPSQSIHSHSGIHAMQGRAFSDEPWPQTHTPPRKSGDVRSISCLIQGSGPIAPRPTPPHQAHSELDSDDGVSGWVISSAEPHQNGWKTPPPLSTRGMSRPRVVRIFTANFPGTPVGNGG